MGITTVPSLVQAIRDSLLLSAKQVEDLARNVQPRFTDPRALARDLIQRGWVTPYQINQVFLGRGRELLLGPYILLARLGEGGMGQVFKARHRHMQRVAALKVIRRDKLGSAEAIGRFYREVQAAAQLDHPNVIAAFDAGEAAGTYYLAMEFVEGADLGKLVKQHGPLPVRDACEYVRQAALGLQHAFERGLVHRDIKPSNLMVQTAGSHAEAGPLLKVLDMGLARVAGADAEAAALTQAHAVLGTPDFIAPEQARNSRDADTRSDLYSLGCTFHFLLAGQVPFPAEAPMEKLLKHYLEEPPRVEALRPEVPAAVGKVVRRLMAKNPDDRFQTPAELARALGALLATPVGAAKSAAGPAAAPDTEPDYEGPAEEPSDDETLSDLTLASPTSESIILATRSGGRRRRRRRRVGLLPFAVAGVGVGLLVALLVVLFSYFR